MRAHYIEGFKSWKSILLDRRQLVRSDGRNLYQYRLSVAEFNDLGRLLRECCGTSVHLSEVCRWEGFSGLFVLYAAEWWRHRFDGSHWSWDQILHEIGADPHDWNQFQRGECVRLGLEDWGLQVRETGGLRYLGSVAV